MGGFFGASLKTVNFVALQRSRPDLFDLASESLSAVTLPVMVNENKTAISDQLSLVSIEAGRGVTYRHFSSRPALYHSMCGNIKFKSRYLVSQGNNIP